METFKRKRVGQTAVSDNQSSSVTLNELANKPRKTYCNFEFQRKGHTITEINLNRAQITESNRKAMNRNWGNQKANPALKTKTGNK